MKLVLPPFLDEPKDELDDSSNEQDADDNRYIDRGLNEVLPAIQLDASPSGFLS